jgi:hypothetical protein
MPALTYQVIDDPATITLDGKSTGLHKMRLQVDCWADKYADVVGLSLQVCNLFNGFQGFIGFTWVNNTSKENVIDEFESARRQFRRILDFYIFFNDTDN